LHGFGSRPLSALDKIDDDSLFLAESADVRSFKRGDVDEHIFAAAVPHDEAAQKVQHENYFFRR
jgi:hypothetical protein